MVKHLRDKGKQRLLIILKASWKSEKFLSAWEMSITVPVFKPDETVTGCKNYSHVTLTSIICKMIERIMHPKMIIFI